ncbi:MAG: hypothetical protein WDN31_06465 [Hyphomicrobium sp.]
MHEDEGALLVDVQSADGPWGEALGLVGVQNVDGERLQLGREGLQGRRQRAVLDVARIEPRLDLEQRDRALGTFAPDARGERQELGLDAEAPILRRALPV